MVQNKIIFFLNIYKILFLFFHTMWLQRLSYPLVKIRNKTFSVVQESNKTLLQDITIFLKNILTTNFNLFYKIPMIRSIKELYFLILFLYIIMENFK